MDIGNIVSIRVALHSKMSFPSVMYVGTMMFEFTSTTFHNFVGEVLSFDIRLFDVSRKRISMDL